MAAKPAPARGKPRLAPKSVLTGYAKAEAKQANFRATWRDCYRYAIPMRDTVDSPTPGEEKGLEIYDSTGMISAGKCVNRIQDALFPPFQEFVKLEPGPGLNPANKDQAQKILDGISKTLHQAINQSNFSTAINEFLLDLMVGTGSMLVNKGTADNPFQFVPASPYTIALEQGPWGTVGKIYRCHPDIPADQVEFYWPGPKGAKLPKSIADKLTADADLKLRIIEVCYRDHATGDWYYDVILADDGGPQSLLGEPWIYKGASPWIVTRWSKAANEDHGRGPIMAALADIRTANKVVELTLANASMSIAGVFTVVDDGVFNPNSAVWAPGAMIPVARNNGHPMGPTMEPLQRSGDFDVANLLMQDQRTAIKQALMDNTLPSDTGPVRSATEILERTKALQVDIGPAFGRIMNELVVPLVNRCLAILQELALIPGDFKVDGNAIKVTVVSPLARMQAMRDVEATVQAVQLAQALAGPEAVVGAIKVEDIPTWLGRKLGMDEALIRDESERLGIQQLMQQMMQRMAAEQQKQPPRQALAAA